FTASALNGVPSWNVTPWRSLRVTVRPSALIAHDVASIGTIASESSTSTSLSNRFWNTCRSTADPERCGSKVGGSASSPARRVPPGRPPCADAWTRHPAIRTPATSSPPHRCLMLLLSWLPAWIGPLRRRTPRRPGEGAMGQVTVRFLGCGDAFGSGGRFQTCFLVRSDTARFLIDCGASSLIAMNRFGVDPAEIDLILLSHLHGDHYGGLPFFLLDAQILRRRTRPLVIAGPPGLRKRL